MRFRWYDAHGKLQRQARRTTRTCHEPDPRPDLAVGKVTATVVGAGKLRYVIRVRNDGRSDVGPFDTVLSVDGKRAAAGDGRGPAGGRHHQGPRRCSELHARARGSRSRWTRPARSTRRARANNTRLPGVPDGLAAPATLSKAMKTEIHPEYVEAHVRCTCGNEFTTRSTQPEIHVEICSNCHPFYTGRQKLVDTGGRVERFKRRAARSKAK